MKSKPANLVPLYITAGVLLLAISIHIYSRNRAARSADSNSRRGIDAALVEQIEALTYDARAKLGAGLIEPEFIATNMATLFFDDQAVEKVNDGTWSNEYAPAAGDREKAKRLFPRLWPWPRFIHGQIVRELAAQNAVAAGFDIMFPELAPELEDEFVPDPVEGLLSSDEFFAQSMRNAGNVFLAVETEDTVPTHLFLTNAAGLGSIRSRSDYAVLRRARPFDEIRIWHPLLMAVVKPLGLQLNQARIVAGELVIPQTATGDEAPGEVILPLNPNGTLKLGSAGDLDFADDPADEGPQTEFPFATHRVWNLGITLAAQALGLDLQNPEIHPDRIVLKGPNGLERSIPLDAAGSFFIDWSIRFDEVRENRSPVYFGLLGEIFANDDRRARGETNLPAKFANRVVLIGSVASGNNMSDFGATPLDSHTPLVTKHLNIANSVLTGRFVERTSLWVEVLLIGVLGLVSALLTWRMRVLAASISIAGLCASYMMFTIWMYVDYRYWIPMVMPLAGGLIVPHFSLVTYRVMFEQKEQRRVRGIFSRIVSPDVVHELLSAERLALGGARRKITVFFADVRGFTEFTDATQQIAEEHVQKSGMSEADRQLFYDQIAAEQLATVNLYLATIADTIKHHRGTLDKYMGDCVMAFWGAPTPNEQHAVCCVRAAIDSQRALDALNQERFAENERRKVENARRRSEGKAPLPLLPLLSLGTGINTGYATVGLMGSDATILNYTVFGREVNLASRLEGASGRGRILISEACLNELQRDDPALAASCIPQAPITPKGFRQAVRVYEVPWKPKAEAVETRSTAERVTLTSGV